MSKVPSTTKLVVESFPDQREWISPMFFVLNKFIQDVIRALNNGLSFADNIQGKEQDLDFVFLNNSASLPKIRWDMISPPKALEVVSAYEASPVSAGEVPRNFDATIVQLAWYLDSQNFINFKDAVKLSSAGGATGLTSQNRYRIRVRITP